MVVDWARQIVLQARRWLPDRGLVVMAHAGVSGIGLIAAFRVHVCLVTRLLIGASTARTVLFGHSLGL